MKKSFFDVGLVFLLTIAVFASSAPNVSADDDKQRGKQSDHALLNNSSLPGPDSAVYCGVGKKAEPWTLYVAASAGSSVGTLTITFRDGDGITFNVPVGGSFSTVQALGGVPEVDDVVRISVGGGATAAMASASVRPGARDPFAGDDEKDNFCITTDGPSGLPGATLGVPGPNPFPADADGNLN